MKIAVVGTSNSILTNGYFPVYQAIEYPNQVDNFSLGGSNCQLIPYSIEKYKIFDTYDFLITDSAVNDGDYTASNLRSPDWLYNELYSIMSMIKEAQIRHLHLIFPTDTAYNEHYQIHRQVCQELNIPYMDIEKIVSAARELGQKELFYDTKHISMLLAKQLAYLIKEERKNIFSSPKSNDFSACCKQKEYILYSLPENFKDEFPTCTKSSSLISDTYLILKEAETLHIDSLPQLNLESISFWTNTNAGYYTLTSENQKQNYNLYYSEAHYTNFKPLAHKPFPINKFLKIQAGINPDIPEPLQENTLIPVSLENNELILNSILFSKELNPPLTWQVKKFPEKPMNYLPVFQKIHSICININKCTRNNLQYIPDDCIFIATVIYPQNPLLRKQYSTLLKKSNNPYFAYHYVKSYLIPRKKYTSAIKILNDVKKQKIITNAISLLIDCHIQLKQFDKALDAVETLSEEKHRITRLQLLCSIHAHMGLPDLFFQEAEQMLELNESYSTLFHIIDHCIILKKYEEALKYAKKIFAEPRNFIHKRYEESILEKVNEALSYINKETP